MYFKNGDPRQKTNHMAENTASWSDTAQELDEDDNLKLKLLIHEFSLILQSPTPGANKLNLSYSWS